MLFKRFLFIIISVSLLTAFSCKKEEEGSGIDQGKIDKELIEQYIQDNNLDALVTSNGLYYIISKAGSDEHPTKYSQIMVSYKGYYLNGEAFDENLAFQSSLFSMIEGWQEGVPLIGRGGKIKLLIPSELGYGDRDDLTIPPNSVLLFDITLYDFM